MTRDFIRPPVSFDPPGAGYAVTTVVPSRQVLLVVSSAEQLAWKKALEDAGSVVTVADGPPQRARELPFDVIVSQWSPAWQPVLERATITPEFVDATPQLQGGFVELLSKGFKGRWCPEPSSFVVSFGLRTRHSVRHQATGLQVTWVGATASFDVIECSSSGLSFTLPGDRLDMSVGRHVMLQGLRVMAEHDVVIEPQPAQIVEVSYAPGGFRVGCRLGSQDEAPVVQINEPDQVASLITKATMLRGLRLNSLERDDVMSTQPAAGLYRQGQVDFGDLSHPFEPLEAIEGRFHFDAKLHRFVTVVTSTKPFHVKLPKRLLAVERRARSRARAVGLRAHVSTAFTFRPDQTGTIEADVFDLSSRGASIELNDALPWPVGLHVRIDGFEGQGAGWLPRKVNAVVRSSSRIRPGRTRLGLAYLNLTDEQSASFASHIGRLEGAISDGRSIGFDLLWELFRSVGLVNNEAAKHLEPGLAEVRAAHQKLYAAPPSFYLSRVVQNGAEPVGHISAIQSYERSWYVFQLAARMNSRNASFVMNRAFAATLEQLEPAHMLRFTYAQENKWSDRIYSTFARRVGDPNRVAKRALDVLQSSPTDAIVAAPGTDVIVAKREQWQQLLDIIRQHEEPLASESADFNEPQLGLSAVSKRYAEVGLARSRTPLLVTRGSATTAVALVESSTPGLDFRGQLSAVMVWFCDPSAAEANVAAVRALIAYVREHSEGRGSFNFPIFIRSGGGAAPQLPELRLGCVRAVDLILRREAYRMFIDYMSELEARYSRLTGLRGVDS